MSTVGTTANISLHRYSFRRRILPGFVSTLLAGARQTSRRQFKGLLLLVFSILLGNFACPVRAGDLWKEKSLDLICRNLRAVDTNTLHSTFGEYLDVLSLREKLNVPSIKSVTIDEIRPILQSAVRLRVGPLELFTDEEFTSSGPCILLFDKETLAAIDRDYELHALWRVRALLKGRGKEFLEMQYLLLGQGKLIAAYPRTADVSVADYAMGSDAYQYRPYLAADIVNDGETRGLLNLRTLETATDMEFSRFRGPFNAAITSLILRDRRIWASYTLVLPNTAEFTEKPISLR